jgi:hypothetical protein
MAADGFYRASGPRATFGFTVVRGLVVSCAPYGRKTMLGRPIQHVLEKLQRHGYQVQLLRKRWCYPECENTMNDWCADCWKT